MSVQVLDGLRVSKIKPADVSVGLRESSFPNNKIANSFSALALYRQKFICLAAIAQSFGLNQKEAFEHSRLLLAGAALDHGSSVDTRRDLANFFLGSHTSNHPRRDGEIVHRILHRSGGDAEVEKSLVVFAAHRGVTRHVAHLRAQLLLDWKNREDKVTSSHRPERLAELLIGMRHREAHLHLGTRIYEVLLAPAREDVPPIAQLLNYIAADRAIGDRYLRYKVRLESGNHSTLFKKTRMLNVPKIRVGAAE